MTAKDLRRLSKTDLLTLLRDQETELEQLRADKESLLEKLEDRTICLSQCGSIADAAIGLNSVFESAQAAADQYLFSVEAAQAAADQRAAAIVDEAQSQAEELLQRAEALYQEKLAEGERKVADYWNSLTDKLDAFYLTHVGLQQMLASAGIELQPPAQEARTV